MGQRHGKSGFSLLEAVFALAVTAVALVWLVSASQHAVEASAVASNRMRATTLGASLAGDMQSTSPWRGSLEGTFEDAPAFRWSAEMSGLVTDGGAVPCKQVNLKVLFPGIGDAEEAVEFSFLVADW